MSGQHKIKVHLFRVRPIGSPEALTGVLDRIHERELSNRIKCVKSKNYRLETLVGGDDLPGLESKPKIKYFNIMNFRAGHGPGQADVHEPLKGINYEGGGPGEDTAILYDPEKSCMAIQFSSNGPRHGAIEEYINNFVSSGEFELVVKLDKEYERKFNAQRSLQKVDVRIDTSQVSKKDFQDNIALRHAYEAAQDLDGTVLDITIAVDGRRKGASLNTKAKELAAFAKNIFKGNSEAIKNLETKGPIDGGRSEIIDLLGGKLTEEVNVAINPEDWRMDIEDRWNALFRVYSLWEKRGYTE